MEKKEFLEIIGAYRRRLNRAGLLKILVFSISIGAGAGILFQGIAFIVPFYYANLYTGAAVLLSVLTAFAAAYLRRSTMARTALVMDSFGFKERIVTAYEHLTDDGEMVRLQREDALRQLKTYKDRIQIKVLPSWKKMAWAMSLAFVLIGMIIMPSEMKDRAKELHQIRQEAKEKEEEIKEVVEDLEQLAREELTPEQLAALQEMAESMQSSMAEYGQATSSEMLAAANEKLDYKYGNMSNQLANLAASLQNGATASPVTAESMQAMAEQLQQMSGNTADPTLASTQGQSGQNGNGQNGQGSGQNGQSDGQSGQSGNNQDGQNGQSGGQSGQSGNNQDGQNGQNGGQNGQSGNNQNGQNGQSGGQSGQSGNGQNGGQGSGDGSGDGQNGQSGSQGSGSGSGSGRGDGSSSTPHDYVSIPNSIIDSGNLTGNAQNHNNSDFFLAQNGLSWEGTPVSHEAVIGSYEQNAYEGIAAGQYPSGMEDVIKEYFASFN